MKKLFFGMMLFLSIAAISTSCNKDKDDQKPETDQGVMAIGQNDYNIAVADAVNYGDHNAITLTSKGLTETDNNGICVIFDGAIKPGTYTFDGSKSDNPKVVGLKEFNMGEFPFLIESDTIYYGDVYFWISGTLTVTEDNGTYTVILTQCTATNASGQNVTLAFNFSGTLTPYTFYTDNKFTIGNVESQIGLASLTSLGMFDTIGQGAGAKSLLFLSDNHKNSFIINFLNFTGEDNLIGTFEFQDFLTPYLAFLNNPHIIVTTAFDMMTLTPETAYVVTSGTLTINRLNDGEWDITLTNAKLTNLEHPYSFFNTTGSLQYHGQLFGYDQ